MAILAPTIISPLSGEVKASSSGSANVAFSWQTSFANPDGYHLRYRLASASTWTEVQETVSYTTTYSKTITLSEGEYVWQVRVRQTVQPGNTVMWSNWTDTSTFSVYDPPTITITQPSATITDMPINYAFTFTDDNGQFASGTLDVYVMNPDSTIGGLKYHETLGSTPSGTITTEEFLPETGKSYAFYFDVASSTTLTASAYVIRLVSMVPPRHGTLTAANDANTSYATLTVGWDNNTGSTAAVSADVYRVNDDARTLIASGLTNGSTVIDKYAPLNKQYKYQVVTFANSGAFYVAEFNNTIETNRWFVIWDGGNKEAWAKWNPTGSYELTRPQKKRIHYVGREYPVSYDGTALDEVHTISFTVLDRDSWSNEFVTLMHDGGRGYYKSVDGKTFWADVEIDNTPHYTSITKMGTVSLTITRIEGDTV